MGTVTSNFGSNFARLANRQILLFYFRALSRSTLSAGVLESQKLKMVGYPAWHRIHEVVELLWEHFLFR